MDSVAMVFMTLFHLIELKCSIATVPFKLPSSRRGEQTSVGAERFPVHEPSSPERTGTEAAEQYTCFQSPFPDQIDGASHFGIVEAAGLSIGCGEIARTDADAAETVDP